MKVASPEAKEACGADNLCEGMEVRIEGGIHNMRLLLGKHAQEEDWGFLSIDLRNLFNEENWTAMLLFT